MSIKAGDFAAPAILAVIFILVSSPWAYEMTQKIFGSWVMPLEEAGMKPTTYGLVIHSLVFAAIAHLVWQYFKIAPRYP